MARALHKLSDVKIRGKLNAGRHSDGGGLYLRVSKSGGKSWSFMFKRNGAKVSKEIGLGPYPDVTLSRAREIAGDYRKVVLAGGDPSIQEEAPEEVTFAEAADMLIESMSSGWRNAKHRDQWKMTLGDAYCKSIRQKSVADIDVNDVLKVLNPIWTAKPETASRIRGRIEKVLDFAKVKGWRSGENPAVWRNNLKHVLPSPSKLSRGHHSAMPYGEVPAFCKVLRETEGLSATALEFLILTAARTGEVIGMKWGEVDLEGALWTVPANRMKAHKIHRVPLSPRAVTILKELKEVSTCEYVFPGERRGRRKVKDKPLSQMAMAMMMRRLKVGQYTPHGFRSAFRDWAGDETDFPREIAEAALAHEVGNEVERAYRRSDALEKRRALMVAWGRFLENSTPPDAGERTQNEIDGG